MVTTSLASDDVYTSTISSNRELCCRRLFAPGAYLLQGIFAGAERLWLHALLQANSAITHQLYHQTHAYAQVSNSITIESLILTPCLAHGDDICRADTPIVTASLKSVARVRYLHRARSQIPLILLRGRGTFTPYPRCSSAPIRWLLYRPSISNPIMTRRRRTSLCYYVF